MRLKRHFIGLVALVLLTGCATQFGRWVPKRIDVYFASKSEALSYYLLTVVENDALLRGYDSLKKSQAVDNFLMTNATRRMADGGRVKFRQGDWILVLDCGLYYKRQIFYFENTLNATLSCE